MLTPPNATPTIYHCYKFFDKLDTNKTERYKNNNKKQQLSTQKYKQNKN